MGVSYMWKSLSWTSVSTANAVFQVVMIWQGVTSWLLGSSSFIHNYMGGFVYYLTKLLWAGISVGSWDNSVSAQRGWARMWNLGGFFLWLLLLLCYSNPLWWICYFRLCWNANLKKSSCLWAAFNCVFSELCAGKHNPKPGPCDHSLSPFTLIRLALGSKYEQVHV